MFKQDHSTDHNYCTFALKEHHTSLSLDHSYSCSNNVSTSVDGRPDHLYSFSNKAASSVDGRPDHLYSFSNKAATSVDGRPDHLYSFSNRAASSVDGRSDHLYSFSNRAATSVDGRSDHLYSFSNKAATSVDGRPDHLYSFSNKAASSVDGRPDHLYSFSNKAVTSVDGTCVVGIQCILPYIDPTNIGSMKIPKQFQLTLKAGHVKRNQTYLKQKVLPVLRWQTEHVRQKLLVDQTANSRRLVFTLIHTFCKSWKTLSILNMIFHQKNNCWNYWVSHGCSYKIWKDRLRTTCISFLTFEKYSKWLSNSWRSSV